MSELAIAENAYRATDQDVILDVQDLRTVFETSGGVVPAVDGVSFDLRRGECLGIVGESGSGKSVTALSILRLIQSPGRIAGGHIWFEGEDLVKASPARLREIRGNRISMIFQEPMTSLNPVFTVGDQITEAILSHGKSDPRGAWSRAAEMLRLVGIPDPEGRLESYPHEMSGGMRQRVMIAMALSCEPALLIADEPTTALDVTIQAQILDLLRRIREETGTGIMLITHDLGVVAELVDRVAVMYAGRVVERADVFTLFERPGHPYTEALLRSIPRVDEERHRLSAIEGTVPNPQHLPSGCKFHPRCPYAQDLCRQIEPPLLQLEGGQRAACWKHTDFKAVGHESL